MFGGGGTKACRVTGYKTKQIGGFVRSISSARATAATVSSMPIKGELKDDKRYNCLSPEGNLLIRVDPRHREKLNTDGLLYMTNVAGAYNGKLKANNHLIGMYHLFSGRFVYNVATLRFGYNRVKASNLSEMGSTNGTVTKLSELFRRRVGRRVRQPMFPTSSGRIT